MSLFKVKNIYSDENQEAKDFSDFVKNLKVSYDTILSAASGTNAKGKTVVDVIDVKRKVDVEFISMDNSMMAQLLNEIDSYEVECTFLNPKTNTEETISATVSTPVVDYYMVIGDNHRFNNMALTFSEM